MIFNSIEFFVYFVIVYAVYRVLPFRGQNAMLVLASYVFYGWWNLGLVFLIVLTTSVDYTNALMIGEGKMTRRERFYPSFAIIFVAFFADTIQWQAVDFVHLSVDFSRLLPSHSRGWLLFGASVAVVAIINGLYPWLTNLAAEKRKKLFLWISILSNLGILATFKYFNFFASSAETLLHSLGIPVSSFYLNLLLPIGISFYTFETLSYTIDVYRGKMQPTHNYLVFALFLAFFPRLVAGPIVRSKDLIPQFSAPRPVRLDQTGRGIFLILLGFFKKVTIADGLAGTVNAIFNNTGSVSWLDIVVATLFFTIQIYCDFSGYSDIARGVAKFFGIELTVNFRLPYFSKTPTEFWRRWHISLSSWLRDYLYISLGGNRKGKIMTYVNLMATMVLGGLWHGAAWNYVLWGIYQGAVLCLYRLFDFHTTEDPEDRKRFTWWQSGVYILLFFLFTLYGWLLFRANSLEQILQFTSILFTGFGNFSLSVPLPTAGALLGVPLLIIYEFAEYHAKSVHFYQKLSPWLRGGTYAAFLILILMGASNAPAQFIYFQF